MTAFAWGRVEVQSLCSSIVGGEHHITVTLTADMKNGT